VADGRILEIHQKIISAPTLRFPLGVMELARMFYPDQVDQLTDYNKNQPITRSDYSALIVKGTHTPIFIPSSDLYYQKAHKVHTYGLFSDMQWRDSQFNEIETAVQHSFIKGYKNKDQSEYFSPEAYVTREDLAYTLYILKDIQTSPTQVRINDLSLCENDEIVQKVVDYGLMALDEESNFNPETLITGREAVDILFGGVQ
jgi:iron complex transport system substrate-binding protein